MIIVSLDLERELSDISEPEECVYSCDDVKGSKPANIVQNEHYCFSRCVCLADLLEKS